MEIQTIDGKVVNDSGQVAVKYFQPIPQTLKIRDRTYIFQVKKSLSIAWIEPEDVQAVLDVVKECCGGNRQKVYRLEHETHVKRWLNWIE
jgi:hypothetical protein